MILIEKLLIKGIRVTATIRKIENSCLQHCVFTLKEWIFFLKNHLNYMLLKGKKTVSMIPNLYSNTTFIKKNKKAIPTMVHE